MNNEVKFVAPLANTAVEEGALKEAYSLMRASPTTVFTFFHHSVQIPAGLLALFSLDKKNKKQAGFLFISPISIWHLLVRDGNAGSDY